MGIEYFNPYYMSLTKPHPILITANSSPYKVIKACIQAKMLSGRYRTERLCRHWSENRSGICLIDTCKGLKISEDLRHILADCPGLEHARRNLRTFTSKKCSNLPCEVVNLVTELTRPNHPLNVHFS